MPVLMLHHHHEPDECRVAYAAWKGYASPLRNRPALSSCRYGEHDIWWELDDLDVAEALPMLPPFVRARTTTVRATRIDIP
jgi:hypothetical protein